MKFFIKVVTIFILFPTGRETLRINGTSITGIDRTLVGAIRWDGWVGNLNPAGLEIEYTLGPRRYHYRAPFYSKEISEDSIQCRATSQEIIDKEISYAKYAGLDYWAFCWYPEGSGLDTARDLYLSSSIKNDIHWCVILGTNPFNVEKDGKWLLKRFKDPNYQKVLNGRPLVYVFSATSPGRSKIITGLRKMCRDAMVPDPYIVAMEFSANAAAAAADSIGANAISCYATTHDYNSGNQFNGAPYSTIMKSDEAGWGKYASTGKKIVPWVTTGWSPKPRIQRSVSWSKYYKANGWAQDGTPDQIAENIQKAVKWAKINKNSDEANIILIYAWNEFDEGGWICPTLGNNTDRLNAIRRVLRK
ncbi:MAG TPA: glycoside hydrolase family 99-like domain-containing protein [Hanamia sp.]|nr:glycoside hydrolase family 99-like domain-containing protein [Hanamia sp.]